MSYPSGSKIARAMACPTSVALPQYPEPAGEAAESGTAIHEYLARITQGMLSAESLEQVPEQYRDRCAVIELEHIPVGEQYAAEVALAYDVATDTAREVGRDIRRDYGKLEATEIPMTADLISVTDDRVIVDDYKTGRKSLGPARQAWQLRALALAAARCYAREAAEVSFVWIREDGSSYRQSAHFDMFDLEDIRVELVDGCKRMERSIGTVGAGEPVKVNEGDHCTYCPAFRSCPAKTLMLRHAIGDPLSVRDSVQTMLDDGQATEAANAYHRLKDLVEVLGKAIYSYARECPIDMGDGTELRTVVSTRERLVGRVAYDVLTELHGLDVALVACDLDASKASVQRAVGRVHDNAKLKGEKPPTRKALMEETLGEIRARGGVEANVSRSVKRAKKLSRPVRQLEAAA